MFTRILDLEISWVGYKQSEEEARQIVRSGGQDHDRSSGNFRETVSNECFSKK